MSKKKGAIALAVIFCVVLALPFLVNVGKASSAPAPSLDTPAINALEKKECIESAEYMRANHMRLLDDWRNEVVRDGDTTYTSSSGQVYEKSLDDTCLSCHSNREEFCESCHDYSATSTYCWDCHDGTSTQ